MSPKIGRFLDKITGSKAERKGLDEALTYLRPGDTLVVWKLDRAGRSLTHLIDLLKGLKERGIEFVSLTEQIDTTMPGGTRGRVGVRPKKLKTNGKVALARRMFVDQSHSIAEICTALGISRATLYWYVKETKPPE